MSFTFKDLPKELEKIIMDYKVQLERADIEKIAKKFLDKFSSVARILSRNLSYKNKIAKEFAIIGYKRIVNKNLTLMKGDTPKKPALEIVKKLKVKEEEKEQLVKDITLALKGFIRTLNKTVKIKQRGQTGGGKKKSGLSLNDLPKELENLILNYKKQLESTDKKYVKKIDMLYSQYSELDNEYEDTQDDDIANQRDDIFIEIEKLVIKFLKTGGDFKRLQLSDNWKRSDFIKKGGAKKKNKKKLQMGGSKK
jgi:hypothetical protein